MTPDGWQLWAGGPSVSHGATERTLKRLGRDSLDGYYLHVAHPPLTVGAWMTAMASAGKAGKIRAVGIRNRNVAQVRKAADVLGRYDMPSAAN